jgi:probable rRNA maturation factor
MANQLTQGDFGLPSTAGLSQHLPVARRVEVSVMPGCRGRIAVGELRRIARHVLAAEDVAPEVEAEVVLATAATVRELNRLYRGRDEETDVLSFAASEGGDFMDAPGVAPSLGEVVICVSVAEARANLAAQPVAAELAHLLTHGLLHTLGYDHEAGDSDALRMQAREDELLTALGYGGLYEHGH